MLWEDRGIGAIGVARVPRGAFTRQGTGAAADLRRPGGDRDPERAAVQGDAGSARRGRSRQRSQERLPGDDEPRDPHADERGDRHERAAARHAARPTSSATSPPPSATRGDALLTIINDILDFSKIEAGRMDIEAPSLRPARVRRVGARPDRPRARPRSTWTSPTCSRARCRAAIDGDVTRLRQILLNLLANAVKFTEHGEVVLTVSATPRGRRPHRADVRGARHRHRPDASEGMGAPVPDVQPGRQHHHAQVRRHRARPGDQQAAGRADGRHDVGRERRARARARPSTSRSRARGRAARRAAARLPRQPARS